MANLLLGKPVADSIYAEIDKKDFTPCLCLFRVGDDEASISYENMLEKKANEHDIAVVKKHLSEDISEAEFLDELDLINNDDSVHGILVFQPLPAQIYLDSLKSKINPKKDIDCISFANAAKIYSGDRAVFVPATAQSVLEILDYYGIDVSGKNVTVVGRSDVIGKPLSLLLMHRNATVTIAHSKTNNLQDVTKQADVVVLATGRAKAYDKNYFSEGQVVIDVGTNVDESGKLVGDVDFEEVEPLASAITPVPRGVGSVTTSVMLRSVCKAFEGR